MHDIEIDANEYLGMKQEINDYKVLNSLLTSQVNLLRSELTKKVGTVQEAHREMYKQKL